MKMYNLDSPAYLEAKGLAKVWKAYYNLKCHHITPLYYTPNLPVQKEFFQADLCHCVRNIF